MKLQLDFTERIVWVGILLSDLITFGKITGEYAAKSARQVDNFEEIDEQEIESVITEMLEPLRREDGENPAKVVDDLRVMMQNKVGIIRTRKLLEEALEDLDDLEARAGTLRLQARVYNPGRHQALEIAAMIDKQDVCSVSADEGGK